MGGENLPENGWSWPIISTGIYPHPTPPTHLHTLMCSCKTVWFYTIFSTGSKRGWGVKWKIMSIWGGGAFLSFPGGLMLPLWSSRGSTPITLLYKPHCCEVKTDFVLLQKAMFLLLILDHKCSNSIFPKYCKHGNGPALTAPPQKISKTICLCSSEQALY